MLKLPFTFVSSKVINSGSYLGSKRDNWLPEGEKFALGYKEKVTVFNYATTVFFLNRAKDFVKRSIKVGGRGFFFGLTSPQNNLNISIVKLARLGQVVSNGSWRGGYVTNTKSFRTRLLNGGKKFSFVVSFRFDYPSFPIIFETKRIKLPLISPVDSNSNPSYFTYPIPGNASGIGVLQLFSKELIASAFSGIFWRYGKPKSLSRIKTKRYNKYNKYFTNPRFDNRKRGYGIIY